MTLTLKEQRKSDISVSLTVNKGGYYFVTVSRDIENGLAETIINKEYYNKQSANRAYNLSVKAFC